jgi:hypothetical protein
MLEETFPLHSYCYAQPMVLKDNKVLQKIQRELNERAKKGFIMAKNVCKIMAGKKIQILFAWLGIYKPTILKAIAQR